MKFPSIEDNTNRPHNYWKFLFVNFKLFVSFNKKGFLEFLVLCLADFILKLQGQVKRVGRPIGITIVIRRPIIGKFSFIYICKFFSTTHLNEFIIYRMQTRPQEHNLYFKQYLCYDFAIFQHHNLKFTWKINLCFESSRRLLQSSPPAALVDQLCKQEVLYVLQWKFQHNRALLYLRTLQQQGAWLAVEMNLCPDYIKIAGEQIFVVAGRELFIIVPTQARTDKVLLAADPILSIHTILIQVGTQDAAKYQPALYILHQNQQKGYYTCQYSLSGIKTNSQGILADLLKRFTHKKQNYLHFEVLIPNIVGLVFLTPTTICLYNLTEMQIVQHTQCQLLQGSLKQGDHPVIRWKIHGGISQFTQTILLVIGAGQTISTFYLMFKYNNAATLLNEYFRSPLTNFSQDSFISWPEVKVIPYMSYIIDGSILVDMVVTTKGLVYFAKTSEANLIGRCRYIQMNNIQAHYQHTILNQQCSIWKYYCFDSENIFEDRLLVPNRYSYQLVKQLQPQNHPQHEKEPLYNSRKAFDLWRKSYGFNSLLIFSQDVFIVRVGSISVFRGTSQQIYQFEYFSQQRLNIKQNEIFGNMSFEHTVNLQQSDYDQFQENTSPLGLPLLRVQSYVQINDDWKKFQVNAAKQQCIKGFQQLQNIMFSKHEQTFSSMKVPHFKYLLICGKVRDKLCQLNLLVRGHVYIASTLRERQANKIFERQEFIVQLLSYYYELYYRSSQHHHSLGCDLISWYISKISEDLPQDIDIAVSIIVQKLMANIIPTMQGSLESSLIMPEDDTFGVHSNNFLQLLINTIVTQRNQKKDKFHQCLRRQLSRFVRIGFYKNKSKFFAGLWHNKSIFKSSLIKSILLANQPQILRYIIIQFQLLKNDMSLVLAEYKNLRQHADEKIRVVIQRQFYKSIKYNLEANVSYLKPVINKDNSESDDYIVNQNIEKLKMQIINCDISERNNLICIDHLEQINQKFTSLYESLKYQEQTIQKIQSLAENSFFYDNQHKLTFYQKILLAFVDLFNHKLAKDHALPYYQSKLLDSQEADQFRSSRIKLITVLSYIHLYYKDYIKKFQQVYGEEKYDEITQKFAYQQKLMTKTFIERPVYLIHQTQLILSDASIELIERALAIDRMNLETQYHNSLLQQQDLNHYFHKIADSFSAGVFERWISHQQNRQIHKPKQYLYNRHQISTDIAASSRPAMNATMLY